MFGANKYDLQMTVELASTELDKKYNKDGGGTHSHLAGTEGLNTYEKHLHGSSLDEVFKFAKNNPQFEESKDFLKLYNKHTSELTKLKEKKEAQKTTIISDSITSQKELDIKLKTEKKAIGKNIESKKSEKELIKGYTIKSGDILSKLTSGIDIKFNKKANLVYPGDTFKIEGLKAIIIRNDKKIIVGELKGNVSIPLVTETETKTSTETKTKAIPSTKSKEKEKPLKNTTKTVGYTVEGKNYIIGEDGEPKLLTYQEITPEFKKALEEYKELLIKVENINLLLSALDQNKKSVKDSMKILNSNLSGYNINNINQSNEKIQNTINNIFNNILDIDNKKTIDLNDRFSVLSYIRNELDNYELVRKNIVEQEFNSLTNISEEDLQAFIKDPTLNQEKIKDILGEEGFKDFQNEVIDKTAAAKKYFNNYKTELQEQFPGVNIAEIQDIVINSFVGSFIKIKLTEIFIDKNQSTYMNGYNGDNKDLALFSDIQGIGGLDFSDKNTNIGYEGLKLIATQVAAIAAGMITFGAGAYAVNAAVYGSRLAKYGKLANKSFSSLNIGGKTIKAGRFAAMSTIEGGAFYIGYGAAQSGIEGKNMYSYEGLAESIAFMGAFKALNGLYKIAGFKVDPTKPLMNQKLKIGSQLVGDGITFSALGLGFEGVLLEPGEWTAETIMQAFLMAAAFRGAGIKMDKIKFKQKKGGGVEVVKEVKSKVTKAGKNINEKSHDFKWSAENPNSMKIKKIIESQNKQNKFSFIDEYGIKYSLNTEGKIINSKSLNKITFSNKVPGLNKAFIDFKNNTIQKEFITKENIKPKVKTEPKETISKDDYDKYVKNPSKIPDEIIENIVNKSIKGEPLTRNESIINSWPDIAKIREAKFNKKLKEQKETGKTKTDEKVSTKEKVKQNKESSSKEKATETSENFNTLVESKLLSLESGKSINIGKSTITKNGDTYKVESNGKTETYSNTTTLLKDIKINRKDKIEFISKNSTEDFIKNVNKELSSNKIELKKEGESYSIFKEGKKIEFEKLSNGEQNIILKKIFPNAKMENISNFFKNDFISNSSVKISNSLTGKSKELFDAGVKKITNSSKDGFDFMKNLTYKGFDGAPAFTTGKLGFATTVGGMAYFSNEEMLSIFSSIIDENKDIITLENGQNLAEIAMQVWIFKSLGIIRAGTYNILYDKIFGNNEEEKEDAKITP